MGITEMDCSQRVRQIAVCGLRRDRAGCWKAGLVLVLLLSSGLAAETQSGTIKGTVKSEAGAAIPHAKVIARSSGGRVVASALTDGHGRFRFPPLQPGTYEVGVEFRGQWKTGARRVSVSEGEQALLNFVGRPAGEGTADKSAGLGPVSFYNDSDFKRGELKNPSGGGGYSNAASEQAVKILNQYLSPRESPAAESGAAGNKKPGESASTPEAALERSGRDLLEKKNYTQAAQVFERATTLYPRSERLLMGLGLSLFGTGKYPEAAGALREAARLAPDDSAPIVMLAETLQFVQDPAAENLLERFSKLHPEKARGRYAFGLSLWRDFRKHRC
ncbi:MAG: carboxypeptidase regulatory-like domain-containing protein, partial [Limisphaerales bacterium]